MKRWLLERGVLLGLGALVLYAWLAPAWVVDGDNAEFSTLARTGGIAHPSGYPLYLLWLHATAWLPGTPAHAAALATAVIGAASVVVLHAACRAWGARPLAATIACAIYAGAPVVMRISSEAEVFALNQLVAAAVLLLAAREAPLRGGARAAALGLVAGLGLANHLSCVFVAPVGIYGVVRAAREARPRAIALAIAGLAVGLLPYAYALAAPDTPLSWGSVHGLGDLVGMFARSDYGTGSLIAHGQRASMLATLAGLARTLGRAWLWLPLAGGVAVLAVRCARGEDRVQWQTLAASFAIAGPVFVSRFNAAPEGIGLYISQRFHLLPSLLLAPAVAVALDELGKRLQRPERGWMQPVAATLGLASCAALSLPYVARVHTRAVEAYAHNVLRMLPPNAVEIVSADAFFYAQGYAQWALGERQDVVVVGWPAMGLAWYRDRVGARGVVAQAGDEPAIVRLVQHQLAIGHAVFVEPNQRDVLRAFPYYPLGPLVRILPRGEQPPPVADAVAQNRAAYAAFDLAYPYPGPDDEWPTIVHERYAQTWATLARAGSEEAAAIARELAPR